MKLGPWNFPGRVVFQLVVQLGVLQYPEDAWTSVVYVFCAIVSQDVS